MADGNELRPRLCLITKWPDFQGYGFNLHAERGKAGQYIGKVDDGSPSQVAGLKDGDRIVEVNGTNIGNENHQQVVGRIKAKGDEVQLLVVDLETDNYYKDQKIVVRGDLPEVLHMSSQQPHPSEENAFHPVPEEVEVNEVQHNDKEDEEELAVASFQVEDSNSEDEEQTTRDDEDEEPTTRDDEDEVHSATPPPEPHDVEANEDEDAYIHEDVNVAVNQIEESHPYKPRLCHLRKWQDFSGYGFNLHADREHGQFIGSIDDNSPSEVGGLKGGDKIIEVDGVNVENMAHKETIQRIKDGGDETTLLVVDREAFQYYKENNLSIHGNLPEVIYFETPQRAIEEKQNEEEDVSPQNSVMLKESPSNPRECHVIKWADFVGYGFVLHASKDKSSQFIGPIDADSPAEAAGLKEHDHIIEVNGVNVESETHQQVIQRVKAGGDETTMLVLDAAADEYYTAMGITVNSSMAEVLHIVTPRRDTAMSNGQTTHETVVPQQRPPSPKAEVRPVSNSHPAPDETTSDLNMGLSAKEMRERLSRKKKTDPRIQKVDFRHKRDAFDRM